MTESSDFGWTECLRSLLFPSYGNRKEHIVEAGDKTCKWIRSHEKFRRWMSADQSGILLVSGKPGCGKSVLAKHIETWLLKNRDVGDRYQVAAFFFNGRGEKIEQTASGMIRALLYQIIDGRRALFGQIPIMKEYHAWRQKGKVGGVEWPLSTLHALFLSLQDIKDNFIFYLIIDSLDEAEAHIDSKDSVSGVVQFLQELVSPNSTCKFKIFLTSRPPTILQKFRNSLHPRIALESTDSQYIEKDVDTYISNQVISYLEDHIGNPEAIIKILRERSNGIFLWVDLVMKRVKMEIEYGGGNTTLLEELNNMSEGMEELYRNILGRLESKRRDFRSIMLQWVLFAERPLTAEEFRIAININRYPTKYLSEDELIRDLSLDQFILQVESHCGGLVEFRCPEVFEDTASDSSSKLETRAKYMVQLIHQSAKDFLLEHRSEWFSPGGIESIKWESAHLQLAHTCLTYLSFDAFSKGPIEGARWRDSKWYRNDLQRNRLLEYAALYWPKHLNMVPRPPEQMWQLVFNFMENKPKALLSYQVSRTDRNHSFSDSVELLHIVSELGYEVIVQKLTENGAVNTDATDEEGRTPLSLAAGAGHLNIVKQLIGKGRVLLNSKDKKGRTPLFWAAANGHEDVVRLLLGYEGIEADSNDMAGSTPLYWAVNLGKETLVRLLLDQKDVNPNSRDWFWCLTPLESAVIDGNKAIVEMLLDHGGVCLESDEANNHQTPLSLAAKRGHLEVVELLLNRGDKLDSKDNGGRTPLMWAAAEGHETVVTFLLEHGAKLDSKDGKGRTSLSHAAEHGHVAVVELLLEKGTPINLWDINNRTPLSWAAENGNRAVVELLLKRGAEVDSRDCQGRTPLSFAASLDEYKGDLNIQLLQEKEARNLEVVKLLLEHGAEVEARDIYHRTPLLRAKERGFWEIEALLSKHSAESSSLKGWEDALKDIFKFDAEQDCG